jgi:putative aldouronate transport system substrate-binding protein
VASAVLTSSLGLVPYGADAWASGNAPVASSVTLFGASETIVKNYNTNWATKFVEHKFDLRINWKLVASSDVTTQEPLLFSSGSYPDVIWDGSFTNAQLLQWGENDHILVPLNKLMQEYAPNVWKAINTLPGYKQQIEAPDGNVYGLPLYNYCFHCEWDWNYYINAGLLQKYGLSMPRTTAQFAHVLAVFRQHGIQAPLTGSVAGMLSSAPASGYDTDVITFLMNSFIPYNGVNNYFNATGDNRKFVFIPAQPGWRAGLEYLHSLYAAGDFSKTVFTQQDTEVENLIARNEAGVVPNGAIQTIIPNYGQASSHYQDWVPLAPLRGPSGRRYAAFGGVPGGGAVFAITNKTSQLARERIMKMMNYIYTPVGTETVQFGPPGSFAKGNFWQPAKKGQDGLVPQQALFNTDWGAFDLPNEVQNKGWSQWGPLDQGYRWRELDYLTPPYSYNGGEALDQLVEAADYAGLQPTWQVPTGSDGVWVPPADAESYATLQTNIENYVGQWAEEFVVGAKSLTSDWSSYLSGLKSLGLSSYITLTEKNSTLPIDTRTAYFTSFQGLSIPSDTKYLLQEGPVPALVKKYMIEDGTPAADFAK